MSYRDMERRLAHLEQEADEKQRAWVESLSLEQLEELCKDEPPELTAAAEAMSDEDLERACDGRMSEEEWQSHVERARERLALQLSSTAL
jgi:hypothetical protein